MKRNKLQPMRLDTFETQKKRTAYHEAGHAIAILVNSELKGLPPIFFRINIHDTANLTNDTGLSALPSQNYSAEIEGGRLVKDIPESFDYLVEQIDKDKKRRSFFCAFFADMLHFLIGPLTEAKYIAQNDDEVFNENLLTLNALHNYGGSSDLSLINEYLQCFSSNKNEQDKLLIELLLQAFEFVASRDNWHKITLLAEHLVDKTIKTIDCNEISELLSLEKVH
ncbi:MAG: hypothetical protein RQ733_05405 [Methyloprofundus sp.]|nr:hypothetical protein [Methyloprofundus sp.]MDT8425391.1 hypothetical protein [Methyloprofundus sp.]